jgi:putative hemolysin
MDELWEICSASKKVRMKSILTLTTILILLTSCSAPPPQPMTAPVPTVPHLTLPSAGEPVPTLAHIPNPASSYCEEQGNELEIRTAADGSQSGVCVFADGSECEEWAYFRNECKPASESGPNSTSTEIPTARPIDPADYQGWWTYTHPVYGFSIMLPDGWIVNEVTSNDPLMNGHALNLGGQVAQVGRNIRMTFRARRCSSVATGVGQGEFLQQGTLDVAGQPARVY